MRLFTIGCLLLTLSPSLAAQSCPGHLLTIEADGQVSAGSKQALQQAMDQGHRLRVGWQVDDQVGNPVVIHWAEAQFLTWFEGEIFAQLNSIHRQVPRRSQARIDLSDEVQHWTGILGTNGLLVNRMDTNTTTGERQVKSWWCLSQASATRNCQTPQWRLLYVHDNQGQAEQGSKEALLNTIRRGDPIRIAWGLQHPRDEQRSVEHVIEPIFLTITDQNHVSAQLPEHIAQASYWDIDQAKFNNPAVMWRGLMTTNGNFDAVWVNRASGEMVRRAPQRARLAWYGQTLAAECQSNPLELAIPGAVISDQQP